jgi:chromosome segregation ATPase
LTKIQTQNEQLTTTLTALQLQMDDLKKSLSAKIEENQKTEEQLKDLQVGFQNVSETSSVRLKEITTQFEAEVKQKNEEISKLKVVIGQKENEISVAADGASQLKKDLAASRNENTKSIDEINKLKEDLGKSKDENMKLKEESETLRDNLDKATVEITKYGAIHDEMVKQVAQLEADLQSAYEKVQSADKSKLQKKLLERNSSQIDESVVALKVTLREKELFVEREREKLVEMSTALKV